MAGRRYDIKMEYYENTGNAVAKLAWASDTFQTKEIIPTTQLYAASVPAAVQGTGTGLLGQYYAKEDLTQLALQRTDATINFNWGAGSPDAAVPVNNFSASWTGQVQPRYSGAYRFYTTSDDGVRLWVDGQPLIKQWNIHNTREDRGTIILTAGQRYEIKMEYYENSGNAVAKLAWSSDYQPREIIPTTQLYAVNATPLAKPDVVWAAKNSGPVTYPASTFLGNDLNESNQTLTITAVGAASNGQVTLLPDGSVRYTPNAGFGGTDSFTYTVTDNGTTNGVVDPKSAVGTVTVDVSSVLPLAKRDEITIDEDAAPVTIDVLANDLGNAGFPLRITRIVSGPANGMASIDNRGTASTDDDRIRYDSNNDFFGTDTLVYEIDDDFVGAGVPSSPRQTTIAVTVTGVNDSPVASNVSVTTSEDGPVVGDLFDVTDVDDSTLTYTIEDGPLKGTAVLSGLGGFSYDPGAAFQALDAGDTELVTFTYKAVDDSLASSAKATVTVTVTGVNDAPLAADDVNQTNEDTLLVIASSDASALLRNDVDVDAGDSVRVAHSDAVSALGATVAVDPLGGYYYNPATSTVLQALTQSSPPVNDTFTYTIQDVPGLTKGATVTITVSGVNDAPIASTDFGVASEDAVLGVSPRGVLTNDSDPDRDESAGLATVPGNTTSRLGASVTILSADRALTRTTPPRLH